MVIVNRSKGQGHAKWLSSRLALVRSYLAPYEGLKSLSDNFESFRTVETVRNVLYNLCLNKSNLIAEFERFLKAYDVLDWNHTKLKEMRSRITQNSMEESMSVLMEGLVTNYYASRLTPQKVEPSPVVSSGGRCDIKVTPRDRPVFFELTSLGLGRFEKNLESVFTRLADCVLDQLDSNRIVKLEIDVTRLPKDHDKHLDVDASSERLIYYFKALQLSELFNSKASPLSFSTDEIERLPEKKKTIYQHKEWELWHGMSMLQAASGYYLPSLISNPVFRDWSRKITPEMVLGCPILFILTGDAKEWPLVEISDKMSFPSVAASSEGLAFLDRIKKKLKDKLQGGQLQPGAPNIVVIRAADWLSYGFETDRDMMPLGFPDLEKAILEALGEVGSPDLSQVRIYESDYPRARVVNNPHAVSQSQLTLQELERL